MAENLLRLDRYEDFDEMPAEVNLAGCEAFVTAHAEYFVTPWNAEILIAWLDDKDAPYTLRNLAIAYRDISEKGLIKKPPASKPEPQEIVTIPVAGSSAVIPPTDEEKTLLEKTRDDITLTDHARKKRDELLRRAAVAQRPTLRGNEPRVVI
jgi:hypothetical protein